MMRPVDIVPGTAWHTLAPGITWCFYQHWATGYLAGEGVEQVQGDGSGCLRYYPGWPYPLTTPPRIAQARLYRSERGEVSALLWYPSPPAPHYRWEIYQTVGKAIRDAEFFPTEMAMERRINEALHPYASRRAGIGSGR